RGLRGGSWINSESTLRSSDRNDNNPDFESSTIGFRVASP
ncbi:MAG: SUMF1/EgtB/PvdO family nonheme iron enzyme, partial [Verrucomicrobiae bacterium]|nr:SUMF1/EgtB/PvdO family nonheme iron enzyme [Verrucomicrobiae bacterium]